MLSFWGVTLPLAALVCMPWTFLTGDIRFMYRVFMWGAATGVRLAGVRTETVGLAKLDPSRNYIYMSNHASNIDPPLMLPLIPGRTSVLVKKELFKVPVLGKAMRMGSMIPVDRRNREAGIAAVHDGSEIVRREKNQHGDLYRGWTFVRRKVTSLQKRPILLCRGMQTARRASHNFGHAIRHAQRPFFNTPLHRESHFS